MKKAYKLTPEEYKTKCEEIRGIVYHHGYHSNQTGKDYLSENTSERVRNRYEKLKAEVDETEIPDDFFFFHNADLYNLYLNRDTDEPITARELYNIVSAISKAVKDAKDSAVSSSYWNGGF